MSLVSVLNYPSSIIRPIVFKWKFSRKYLWLFLLGFVLPFLLLYIFQVNSYAKETYLIEDYQERIAQLTQENKGLEVSFSKTNSLSNVEEYLKSKNFEKVSQVTYIQILETQVVKR